MSALRPEHRLHAPNHTCKGRRTPLSCQLPKWNALIVTAALAFAPGLAPAQASELREEYDVKAALLLHFISLSRWDERALPSGSDHDFIIGVAGRDPFSKRARALLTRRSTRSKNPIRFVHVTDARSAAQCHLLFLPRTMKVEDANAFVRSVAGKPVMTVSEEARVGGAFRFHMLGKKVRFHANRTAIKNAGISVSSRLLKFSSKPRK